MGFILIIVLALLGVTAALAIQLVNISNTSEVLSHQHSWKVISRLHARSGIESAYLRLSGTTRKLHYPIDREFTIHDLSLTGSAHSHSIACVTVDDPSGKIYLNDGISAGKILLGTGYNPAALDPYASTTLTADKSAVINLRLRRLLNAYGDVWKYQADIDFGDWDASGPPALDPIQNFIFTSSDAQDRHQIIASATHGVPIPTGNGLGDLIISNRPIDGFTEITNLIPLINQWGQTYLTTVNPFLTDTNGKTIDFYDLIKSDLTLYGIEDNNFYQMSRDFGPYYDNDYTQFDINSYRLDNTPMDLENNLWQQHPVHRINLNESSAHIRAAIFYAPTNVEYLCEGTHHNFISAQAQTRILETPVNVPTIGIGGPIFESTRITENGSPTGVQKQRLMSLRDAWMLSMAYLGYSASSTVTPSVHANDYMKTPFNASNWPDSFKTFKTLLKTIRVNGDPLQKQPYERADLDETPTGDRFAQNYVEETLPYILSPYRRMPGWQHAPIAMLSSYHQSGGNNYSAVLRSVEDFVRRVDIPKVRFTSPGTYKISSFGRLTNQNASAQARLTVTAKIRTEKTIRTQKDMLSITDGTSATSLKIGPEFTNNGVNAHTVFGFVGLKPIETDVSPGTRPRSVYMKFDENFDQTPAGLFNFDPVDPMTDTFTNMPGGGGGSWLQLPGTQFTAIGKPWVKDLMTSALEDTSNSIFTYERPGAGACDLSPFGGVSFTSLGHGVSIDTTTGKASPRFVDSMYWRPYHFIGSTARGVLATTQPGAVFNKGTISMWYRVPSGLKVWGEKRSLLHLMIWRRVPTDLRRVVGGTGYSLVTRPISVHLYNSTTAQKSSMTRFDIEDGPMFHPLLANQHIAYNYLVPFNNDIPTSSISSSFSISNAEAQIPNYFMLGSPNLVQDYSSAWPFNTLTESAWINYIWSNIARKVEPALSTEINGKTGVATLKYIYKCDNFRNRWNNVSGPNQVMRPGSWVRVQAVWDYGDLDPDHNFDRADLDTFPSANMDDSDVVWNHLTEEYSAVFNPQMIMTLGEAHNTATRFIDMTERPFLPDTHFSCFRLNSLIDDVDVRFGAKFTGDLEANVSTKTWRYLITDGDATKYDSTVREPSWVIDPGVPEGHRIVAVTTRTYDVPGDTDPQWVQHTPWVDIELVQNGSPTTPTYKSPVGTSAPFSSPELAQFASTNTVDANTKINLTWRALSPTGAQYLSPMLADIPWVEEVVISHAHVPIIESFIWD